MRKVLNVDAGASQVGSSSLLWVDAEYRELFARSGLRTLDDAFAVQPSARFDKASLPSWRERLAVDLVGPSGETRRFYVKRFDRPPARVQRWRVLAGHGRRSTAGVERHWIDALCADGVSVPKVAAFGEQRRGAREERSVLILAEVPGTSLEKWVERHPRRSPPAAVDALAEFVAGFHGRGYVHRDLYTSHIFVDGDDLTGARFTLIDLQRVMRRPFRHRRWVVRDLAQLDFSVPESVAGGRQRLRFLTAYMRMRGLRRTSGRVLMSRIRRMSVRIAARESRRARRRDGRGAEGAK